MEVKYIIIQNNLSNNQILGVQIDVTGSIYMVKPDNSFRFSNIETAQDIKSTLNSVNNVINKDFSYQIQKETRESVEDGTTGIE